MSVSYQEQNAYQAQFLEAELQASWQYKAAQEDTRAFRHDVQNNLTVIAMMMQEGKIEDAQHYLNDLRSEISALSPKVVTGDEMVDALISAKLARISECGITFRMDGVIDGGLNWKPMDICTVFANLLDNAIEAAANTENGFIDLEFKKSEHHRLIRASNNCAEELDCDALMLSDSHFTSKQDKALHGYGIGNIRKTVEKNGGMMKVSCAEHVFTMEIILPKNL
ncbi:MAG: GHKL domain-containing protein [Oscillospiraceae bacterium]|nr:GHKL domain-containing protein [Oscillospiraceae bacterium]